jgi:hypothetical protein
MTTVRALPLLCLALACAEAPVVLPGGTAPTRPPVADDDLLAMVPAEADVVLWADMAKLRSSSWTRESFAKVAEANSGEEQAAFDQIRDIDRVVFAMIPTLQDGASVLVAQGKFDSERMRKTFVQGDQTVEKSDYRGVAFFTRGQASLAFVSQRTVLSGVTVAVRAAVDCSVGLARAMDAEPWLHRLGSLLGSGKSTDLPVASLYVRLQPATREELMREMGEGQDLEEFAARLDLGSDLDVRMLGTVRTELQARDLAARLMERLSDVRVRPIVAVFGLAGIVDSVHFLPKENRVEGTLHVSRDQRAEIADRMTVVAETIAKLRQAKAKAPATKETTEDKTEEKKTP